MMAQRHCDLLAGSATIQVGLEIQLSRRVLTQQKVLGSVTVLEGENRQRLWNEGWVQDGVTVKAGNHLLEMQSGAQGQVHTDRQSAGWMPARPLEHRCWTEGAAAGQESSAVAHCSLSCQH